MNVIPSINEAEFSAVAEKIKKAEEFLSDDGWVQIDISDGNFSSAVSWNNPEDLKTIRTNLNIELHLMINEVEANFRSWLDALMLVTSGKKRVIIHFEAMKEPDYILSECRSLGIEAGIALNPETDPQLVTVFLPNFSLVQVLAVAPGFSGQVFDEKILSKIKFLREREPNVIIEVDGGMNPETAKMVKDAGADAIVAGSYIWQSPSPREAYEELSSI